MFVYLDLSCYTYKTLECIQHSLRTHWPRGMGWRGWWEGVQDGNTCTPLADSCQCMTKPLQYCKVTSLQLNKLKKNPPAMQETWVWFLSWQDLLEKGKATPTSVFWPGEFHGRYSPWGCKKSDTTEWLSLSRIMVHKLYLKKFYYTSKSHVFFVWPSVSSAADRVNKMKIKNWPLIFAKWHHLTKPFHSGRTD